MGVARYGNEIERDAGAHGTNQVRHEHEAALQYTHEVDLLTGRVVALDLRRYFPDSRLDAGFVDEDVHCFTASATLTAHACASRKTARSSSVSTRLSRMSTRP